MTSCSILFSCLKGDVTRAGRNVKRHCPPSQNEISNRFSRVVWYRLSVVGAKAVCHHVTASYVLLRVSNVGAWPALAGRKDGWMEVDRPALRPTCCLSNALIRFRCEWTWHCDIKEFHSLDVSSSPYCINMPLMFHSDTGLFLCTSPITNLLTNTQTMTWLLMEFTIDLIDPITSEL